MQTNRVPPSLSKVVLLSSKKVQEGVESTNSALSHFKN
jgi:hypothetical protein